MKLIFRILLMVATLATTYQLHAQQNVVYSHYYLNPFLYNPSFAASNGYSELYLNYRSQWSGLEGAPTTGTISLQLPLNSKIGLGFTGLVDKAGVLSTSTGMASFTYQVYLGSRVNDEHKIAFGLSAGASSVSIEPDDSYANDPVVGTSTSFEGQFGIHYRLRNLKIAAALPHFQAGIDQLRTTISSASYAIQLSERIELEPMVMYRTYEHTAAQVEGLGLLRIDNKVWLGASYRQRYGATALGGFSYKDKLKLAYAYEFGSAPLNALGGGTHEVQLVLQLGKKKQAGKPEEYQQVQPVQREVENEERDTEIDEEEKSVVVNNEAESPGDTEQLVKPTEKVSEVSSAREQKSEVENEERDPEVYEEEMSAVMDDEAESPDDTDQVVEQTEEVYEVSTDVSASGAGDYENLMADRYFVVVGAFRYVENAEAFLQELRSSGYPANIGFQPEKKFYIVYVEDAPTFDEARKACNKYRNISQFSFPDTWILRVP